MSTPDRVRHEFNPGYTGLSVLCNELVLDGGGAGTTCNLPREQHVRCVAPPGSEARDE